MEKVNKDGHTIEPTIAPNGNETTTPLIRSQQRLTRKKKEGNEMNVEVCCAMGACTYPPNGVVSPWMGWPTAHFIALYQHPTVCLLLSPPLLYSTCFACQCALHHHQKGPRSPFISHLHTLFISLLSEVFGLVYPLVSLRKSIYSL